MIRVQKGDFDIGLELEKLTKGNSKIGGVCSFIGLVRDFAGGGEVTGMTLEHYPEMTERALKDIDNEAHKRWSLEGTLIVHRYGRLEPGERIVLVCAASCHRNAAIEACNFLIDWLKTKAPFWKREEMINGAKWVEAREGDEKQALKWEKNLPPNGSD